MSLAARSDWFLREWLDTVKVSQADLMRLTDWDKRKTSELVTGKQRYNRDILNEAADALNVRPFELLLHPDDAMALRRLRQSAIQIAAESKTPFTSQPPVAEIRKTG